MIAPEDVSRQIAIAEKALLAKQPQNAIPALEAGYDLLKALADSSQGSPVLLVTRCTLDAVYAGSRPLAFRFATLLVEEAGCVLEDMGQDCLESAELGQRKEFLETLRRACTWAVAFIPFVEGARRANLLGPPCPIADPAEVQAIDEVLQALRPELDRAGWATWEYPLESAARARKWAAFALIRWGSDLLINKDSGESIEFAQEYAMSAERLLRGLQEDEVASDYWNLSARIFMAYGDAHHNDAAHAMGNAIRIAEAVGNTMCAARDRSNRGALFLTMAGFARANRQPENAAELEKKAEDDLLCAAGPLAEKHQHDAYVAAQVNLGALYSKQKRWEEADKAWDAAWGVIPHLGDQGVHTAIRIATNRGSSLFDRNLLKDAERWLRLAVANLEGQKFPEPEPYLIAHGTLGRILGVSDRATEGYDHLDRAVSFLERFRVSFHSERSNSGLVKSYRWIYEATIDCCATLGAVDPARRVQAFETAELIKWRTLTVTLRYLPLGLLDPVKEPLAIEEERLLREAIAALGAPAGTAAGTVPAALTDLEELWKRMEAAHPHYVAFRRQETITFAEVKTLLDDQVSCLVEFYLGDQYGTALAFVIARGSEAPIVVRLQASPDEIGSWVEKLRAETDTCPAAGFLKVSRELHRILIEPLGKNIPEDVGVCVVPYGPLHNLTFAGIWDGSRFLVERNGIVIAPTAGALRWWVEKDGAARDSCLIFTATKRVYSGQERQADLVFFEHLARAQIAPLFPQSVVIATADATKKRLIEEIRRDPAWNVVHVACHGEFPPPAEEGADQSGFESRLLMAGDPSPDKDLTAGEIFSQLRVRASLVTLSACDSAIAQWSTNDELTGLAHAFLLAGASSVLATLCYVRQEDGVAVSEGFYKLWRGQSKTAGVSKIRALQQAQVRTLRRRSWCGLGRPLCHPQQWSSFQLYGSWK